MAMGKIKYVPKPALDEIYNIKEEWGVCDGEAFRKMASYSVIGREVERINPLLPKPRRRK